MEFSQIKRIFLQILVGCLVGAALIAVAAVLTGEFNDVLGKALLTILVIGFHALVSFGFIASNEKKKKAENLEIFTNATFVIIILSFITAVFGTWGLLGGELVWKLYMTYFVLLFATLHGEVLAQTLGKERYIDRIVYSNYIFMAVVVVMLIGIIFVSDTADFGEAYYRLLAACGIIDATLTLLAIILHKLYLQKHPTVNSAVFGLQPGQPGVAQPTQAQSGQPAPAPAHRGINILVIILVGFLALQFIGSLAVAFIGRLQP